MRKRLILVVAPLCALALVATVAGAAPSEAEQAKGPRLDELHAGRPTAAVSKTTDHAGNPRSVRRGKAKRVVHASWSAPTLERVLGGWSRRAYSSVLRDRKTVAFMVAAQAAAAAAAAADAAAAAARAAPPDRSVYSDSAPGDFLSCVRNRESGGDYGVHNQGGSGAAGAYQFLPDTWDSIAASVGRVDLVGLDPAQAAPADQDALAQALFSQQGSAPWGGSCS